MNEILSNGGLIALTIILSIVLVLGYKLKKKKLELEITRITPIFPFSNQQLQFHQRIDKAVEYLSSPDSVLNFKKDKVEHINELLIKHSHSYATQDKEAYNEIAGVIAEHFPEADYVYIKKIK